MTADDDRQYDRVLWRSRRGMLELDLSLVEFARVRYPLLSCADQAAFRELLERDDWTIWEWLQRQAVPTERYARIVDLIGEFLARVP